MPTIRPQIGCFPLQTATRGCIQLAAAPAVFSLLQAKSRSYPKYPTQVFGRKPLEGFAYAFFARRERDRSPVHDVR